MSVQDEINNCRGVVGALWPQSQIEIQPAQGGLIVEVVDATLVPANLERDQKRLLQSAFTFNASERDVKKRFVIHRALLYEHPNSRFCVPAMLHTRRAEYVDGIFTSYLDAGDAKAWMRELDSEALLLGVDTPREIQVMNGGTAGMFEIDAVNRYLQIAFEGRYLPISSVRHVNQNFWTLVVD